MVDPKQPKYFFKTINGKSETFKHFPRHKANSRSIALTKHSEYLKKNNIEMTQIIKDSFKSGYNSGYDEARRRTNKLRDSQSKTNTNGK